MFSNGHQRLDALRITLYPNIRQLRTVLSTGSATMAAAWAIFLAFLLPFVCESFIREPCFLHSLVVPLNRASTLRAGNLLETSATRLRTKSQFVDFYAVLGVPANATSDEIKRAYRKRVSACHPDVDGSAEAAAAFAQAKAAYSCLRNTQARAAFDTARSAARVAELADSLIDDVVVPLVRDVGVPALKIGARAAQQAFENNDHAAAAAAGFVMAGPVGALGAVAADVVIKMARRPKRRSLTGLIAALEARAADLEQNTALPVVEGADLQPPPPPPSVSQIPSLDEPITPLRYSPVVLSSPAWTPVNETAFQPAETVRPHFALEGCTSTDGLYLPPPPPPETTVAMPAQEYHSSS